MEYLIPILLCFIIVLLIIVVVRQGKGLQSPVESDLERKFAAADTSLKSEFSLNRKELNENFANSRIESAKSIKDFSDSLNDSLHKLQSQNNSDAKFNREELAKSLMMFQENFANNIKSLTDSLEKRLKLLQEDNNLKLEKMRETVDEKLQSTLEKRLSESFKLVSERLEQVHTGLGEMKNLAVGVGDIKKVLTNIKTRGVLGEYQLENILEQILTRDQYSRNVKTRSGSSSMVEFAVKLPGREKSEGQVWLPIDSKFPTSDYQLLIEAYELGDSEKISESRKNLVKRIKDSAKEIREKYIEPPDTTDFAIMFLPFEGLYAEVLNIAGTFETIQSEHKIIITGPTTLSALLNSLQMGFRTLAIEKRSSEVWEILGGIKSEFRKFGVILNKTREKLQGAMDTIQAADIRSRAIERKLKDVHEMPTEEQKTLFLDEGYTPEDSFDRTDLDRDNDADEKRLIV